MKSFQLFFLLIPFFALTACGDKAEFDPTVESTWRHTATLTDPGDGSGTFRPVNSQRVLKLLTDGTYEANADVCLMASAREDVTTTVQHNGTYDLANGTIAPEGCVTIGGEPLRLEVSGDQLTIRYLCFEACAERYTLQ